MWSDYDIEVARKVRYDYQSPIWKTWSKDPTKVAVIRAIGSCQARVGHYHYPSWSIAAALAQQTVCFLHPHP